jgi:hypothetical protein
MQIEETIKKLQGDMQTKDRELVHADRLVEKEKFKSALKGIQSSLEASKLLADARMRDAEKKKKESVKEKVA